MVCLNSLSVYTSKVFKQGTDILRGKKKCLDASKNTMTVEFLKRTSYKSLCKSPSMFASG